MKKFNDPIYKMTQKEIEPYIQSSLMFTYDKTTHYINSKYIVTSIGDDFYFIRNYPSNERAKENFQSSLSKKGKVDTYDLDNCFGLYKNVFKVKSNRDNCGYHFIKIRQPFKHKTQYNELSVETLLVCDYIINCTLDNKYDLKFLSKFGTLFRYENKNHHGMPYLGYSGGSRRVVLTKLNLSISDNDLFWAINHLHKCSKYLKDITEYVSSTVDIDFYIYLTNDTILDNDDWFRSEKNVMHLSVLDALPYLNFEEE